LKNIFNLYFLYKHFSLLQWYQ